jgi:hypothetical protein
MMTRFFPLFSRWADFAMYIIPNGIKKHWNNDFYFLQWLNSVTVVVNNSKTA